MAHNTIVIDAPPAAVYGALLDPSTYPDWVVGAKRLRAVDRGWPARGRRFHHSVGVGPAHLDDTTKLLDKEENRRVVLEVRFRPVGVGTVAFELEARDGGRSTHVDMTEQLTGGPARRWRNGLTDAGLSLRNALSLRRLRRLVASGPRSR